MSYFETYSNYKISDVPLDNLKVIIEQLVFSAGVDMGQKPEDITIERVVWFVTHDFSDFTCLRIASIMRRGALGQFGAGRLVPRTIYGWLSESKNEALNKSGAIDKIDTSRGFRDLMNFPIGKAIMKKIDWQKSGAITGDEWDRIDPKVLSEMIAKDMTPTPEDFGIEPKI
jgi:hypothetical protein